MDVRRRTIALLACTLLSAGVASAEPVSIRSIEALEGPPPVVRIHLSAALEDPPRTRVVRKTAAEPDRIAIDLPGADVHGKSSREVRVGWGGIRRLRLGMPTADAARVVIELDRLVDFDVVNDGDLVDVTLGATSAPPTTAPPPPSEPPQ